MVDSTIDKSKTAFMYNAHYRGHPIGANVSVAPVVEDINVQRVTGSENNLVADIEGLSEVIIKGVVFKDVQIGAQTGFKCSFTTGTAHNVTPAPCKELTPQ